MVAEPPSRDPGLSTEFRAQSEQELAALVDCRNRLQDQLDRQQAALARLEREAAQYDALISELEQLLGRSSQLDLPLEFPELRGRRIHEVAVGLLRDERGEGATVRYTEWFELLVSAGYRVVAKDPLATFLTQISRAPGVERVGRRTGLYRLAGTA